MLDRGFVLCGWRDSNPHARRRQILSLVRLPISPHPRCVSKMDCKGKAFIKKFNELTSFFRRVISFF